MPTGLAVAIPEGYAGFVQPRSGLAARHGITIVNSPGLIDSGYRGEIQVVLLNTDRERRSPPKRAMRIAQLVVLPVPELGVREVDDLPPSERGVRGFGSSRLRDGTAHPRLGHPPARGPDPAHPPGEARPRVLAPARGRRQRGARASSTRFAASSTEEVGIERRPAPRRAGRDRRLDRAVRAPAKHVVHIVFAGELGGRSLEGVTSRDAAVRGHRLFGVDELAGRRPAPADPALPRPLAAGDPVVYLGAMWAPWTVGGRSARRA